MTASFAASGWVATMRLRLAAEAEAVEAKVRVRAQRARAAVRGTHAWSRRVGPVGGGDLPTFLIIGSQRCGTTSLFNYLAAHPDVRPPLRKEIQFFSLNYERGLDWYRGFLPRVDAPRQTFEASPYYIFDDQAPGRIAQHLPDAKMLLLVRDPVRRAYSHYEHSRALGQEKLSFRDALDAEANRLDRGRRLGQRATQRSLRQHSYVARGRYADQLEHWGRFVPLERVKVVRSEDLFDRTGQVLDGICRFLGLAEFTPPTFARENHHATKRPSELTADLRMRLHREFVPHNERLRDMMGWAEAWPAPSAAAPSTEGAAPT